METGVAVLKVFSLPELLEIILLFTSEVDIFVAHRVNKTFNSTICNSPNLQRKMVGLPKITSSRDSVSQDRQAVFPNFTKLAQHFQLKPFQYQPAGHFDFASAGMDAKLCLRMLADDGQQLGWQGKSSVHIEGRWRNIKLGSADRESDVSVQFYGRGNLWSTIPFVAAECTIGDIFDVLQERRSRYASRDLQPGTVPASDEIYLRRCD